MAHSRRSASVTSFGRAGEPGVGLGLVLVRRIAEHHGGRARLVESGPAGTTFEVTLPLG